MTRPTDWDFSKISGGGETPARSAPLRGAMPTFASHVEERSPHPGEALPWAEIEFERISKSPRRATDTEPAPITAAKRRFARFRLQWTKPNPSLVRMRPKLPAFDWRAPVVRGSRVAAFGFRVAVVTVMWLSAELVYFVRLGYAHARLTMPRLAREIGSWNADRFSGVDLWPLARHAATVAVFVAMGYGAAIIVGPVLKNDGMRLVALPSPSAPAVASADQTEPLTKETQAVIASLDTAVPLPMPRISGKADGRRSRSLHNSEGHDTRFAGR